MTAKQITAPQLRDYQIDIVQQIFDHWFSGSSAVAMQLPTGAGKTIIFTAVANELIAMGEPVLVIAFPFLLATINRT